MGRPTHDNMWEDLAHFASLFCTPCGRAAIPAFPNENVTNRNVTSSLSLSNWLTVCFGQPS